METRDYVALAALVIAAATLAYNFMTGRAQKITEITKDVASIKSEVATIQTKIGLFWHVMELKAAEILHKPIHYERDALIEKHLTNSLTPEERMEFVQMLQIISTDKNEKAGDRLAASMLLAVIQVKEFDNERG